MDHNQRADAVEAFRSAVALAQTQTAFGREVGLLQQTVSNLLRRGDVLPPEAVLATERAYGISRHVLRPDIYPPVVTSGPLPTDGAAVEAGVPTDQFDRDAGMKRAAGA